MSGYIESRGENCVLLRPHFFFFFRKLNPLIDWFIHSILQSLEPPLKDASLNGRPKYVAGWI